MTKTTITLDREHIDGVRYLLKIWFEYACNAEDEDWLRAILPAMQRIRLRPDGTTIELPEKMAAKLVAEAWSGGNDIWGDVHQERARGEIGHVGMTEDERIARS